MSFNEDTRVKLPAILHLTRLGFKYISLKDAEWDIDTNIFTDIFHKSVASINPDICEQDIDRLLQEVKLSLDNDDLGRAFFERLVDQSDLKLIDLNDFSNNSFHVVTELTCKKGEDEFRPDITLLINGLPLFFIEVKKPNNKKGILAERERINCRFKNRSFKRFINITQLMVFSNNMEYSNDIDDPVEGAFYSTTSYDRACFNFFREREKFDLSSILNALDDQIEDFVLQDTNYTSIKFTPEFDTNKSPDTPTNRILTSLFQRERMAFLLKYAFVYVHTEDGLEKHVMRYPQLFATKSIETMIKRGDSKGVIWHTQGSGKTALSYYNVAYLTDYYSSCGKVAKFYFIVDRIDLLIQARREFSSRGLVVHTVNTREEFSKDIKSNVATHNAEGKLEITVVNIQRFEDDDSVIQTRDYNTAVQRVFFIDEAHRSYKKSGTFLKNLLTAAPDAIKISLTGTPLLGDRKAKVEEGVPDAKAAYANSTRALFGDYIDTYYYNQSIADGYTRRLIREEVVSNYRMVLQKLLADIKVEKGNVRRDEIYAHRTFVDPMLEYIIRDFEKSRITFDDPSIGAMVICDSSKQARMMYEIFQTRYAYEKYSADFTFRNAAEDMAAYRTMVHKHDSKARRAALILHDAGTKEDRKDLVEEFKDGKIDILFVYNMLITGFDAPRLKKLYMGRVVKSHNLLQALTRVNRPYRDHRYGYVVDFADIKDAFEQTSKDYFQELQDVLGNESRHYSNLFKSKEEIEKEIDQIENTLAEFELENAEVFAQQISAIQDAGSVRQILTALDDAKALYNEIRIFEHYELIERLDFKKLKQLCREAVNHLAFINMKCSLESKNTGHNMLNLALEDVIFAFRKISEEELKLADTLKEELRITRETLLSNIDKKDPEFISLKAELEELFRKYNITEWSGSSLKLNMRMLHGIFERARELNRRNSLLSDKYRGDPKYARVYKRVVSSGGFESSRKRLTDALNAIKNDVDQMILCNSQLLADSEDYFKKDLTRVVIDEFERNNIDLNPDLCRTVQHLIFTEYQSEHKGEIAW